jgi:hypothetical protein
MGPRVDPSGDLRRMTLRPFATSQTYRNLKAHGEGVFHITDDVLLIARAAVGEVEPPPSLEPATRIRGFILPSACRYHEFRVTALDDRTERTEIEVETVAEGRRREWMGFNRARHAVLEAAILATRTHLLPPAEIAAEFERLAVPVSKTGGPAEREAFDFLKGYVASRPKAPIGPPAAETGAPS